MIYRVKFERIDRSKEKQTINRLFQRNYYFVHTEDKYSKKKYPMFT